MRPSSLLAALTCLAALLPAVEPPKPFGPTPSPRQLAWMDIEYYGFVHYGLNTYTGKEWGYGDESPSLLALERFDADGIAREAKAAGMGGLVVVAKHHDGFCLWPTDTTPHNIRKAPYKGGKGDIVGEMAEACRRHGLKLGIYVSPWDRNYPEYGRDAYKQVFINQVEEVLTRYGDLFMMWFDGANGGDGYYGGARERRQIPKDYYPWGEIMQRIRKHQPMANVFGGPDVRWVGNEKGIAAETCWAVDTGGGIVGGDENPQELNVGSPKGKVWRPAECDVSIRPGWFYHAHEDNRVKDVRALAEIYFASVGRGQALNLNVPPTPEGRWHERDIASLRALRAHLDALFKVDFTQDARAVSQHVRGGAARFNAQTLLDGKRDTYWCGEDGNRTPVAEITLSKPATVDVLRLREYTPLGQRVESFSLDAWVNNEWQEVAQATTVGHQRLLRFPAVTADRFRLRITAALAVPCLSEFSLFKEPEGVRGPNAGLVRRKPVGWSVVASSNDGKGAKADKAIDGDVSTFWHTHPVAGELPPPQSFTVDTGKERKAKGFFYVPRQDNTRHGLTDRYRFEGSLDGKTWTILAEGEFGNLRANPQEQAVTFTTPTSLRYFRFTGLRALERNHVSAAEVGLIE